MMSKITVSTYESEGQSDEFEICILKKIRSNPETLICVCVLLLQCHLPSEQTGGTRV